MGLPGVANYLNIWTQSIPGKYVKRFWDGNTPNTWGGGGELEDQGSRELGDIYCYLVVGKG